MVKTSSSLRMLCCMALLSFPAGSANAMPGGLFGRGTPSPTSNANPNLLGSAQLQADRAQTLVASKDLVHGSITDEVISRLSVQVNQVGRSLSQLDTNMPHQDFALAVKRDVEQLYHLLMNLPTDIEKANPALAALIPGSDCQVVINKNDEILSFLELYRSQKHGLLRRLLINKYTMVGVPVVAGSMGYLYREDLAPVYAAMRQGAAALVEGNMTAAEVVKKVADACKEIPNARLSEQLKTAAQKIYSVATNERKRKTIALTTLSSLATLLALDTTFHKPNHAHEARTRGTYAPSRLLHYLNNSLRLSSGHSWRYKTILGVPAGVIAMQALLGLAKKTDDDSWNLRHLPGLLSMRENWLYKAFALASANVAAHPDRVGFKLYAKVIPWFAGNPTKIALFTILTAGLASHSIRSLYADYRNDNLPWYDKVYYGITGTSETVGAVALAALLTNWLSKRPAAQQAHA